MLNAKKFLLAAAVTMSFSYSAAAAPLGPIFPPTTPIVIPIVSADPGFQFQWNLKNTGQNGGTAGIDILAVYAWGVGIGSNQTVVAVLDSGIDPSHLDLDGKLWVNSKELQNGLDDDKNGYVDDIIGANVVGSARNGTVADVDGLGTHVAGIIGAESDNGRGIAGIDWASKIMPVKIYNSSTTGGTVTDLIEGLEYAVMMRRLYLTEGPAGRGANVRVIHISSALITAANLNCEDPSINRLRDVLKMAHLSGISVATVAGTSVGNPALDDNDLRPLLPASCDVPNIIAAAGHDNNGTLGWFSRWGKSTIDIAAPGDTILSTYPTWLTNPNNPWGYLSGTASAAAHVSGTLSLMYGVNPNLSPSAARNIIVATAKKVTRTDENGEQYSYWQDKVTSGGILNSGYAMVFARAKKNRPMFTDGVLNYLDIRYILASYGRKVPPFQMADLTGDGYVDITDIIIFMAFSDIYIGH